MQGKVSAETIVTWLIRLQTSTATPLGVS